jgi:AraC-like DNA-binding protein
MPGRQVMVAHSHPVPHVLVVLEGEIHEDGRVYGRGDIRLSSARDRHFIRFARTSRCLVIEGGVPGPPDEVRRVIRLPTLFGQLQNATSAEQVVELANRPEVADTLQERRLPPWLQELESRRLGGAFVRTNSVCAIARRAGVSREHLVRCYQRQFGTTVIAAMRAARLKTAFDALQLSTHSLADVADACGFADQSHMTRQFSEWIGTTPGQVRRRASPDVTSVQDSSAAAPV